MKKAEENKEAKGGENKDKEKKGGLKIETLKPEVIGVRVRPNLRLWLTADGKTLVPEGHEDAAVLYCTGNNSVPKDEFDKLKQVGFKK